MKDRSENLILIIIVLAAISFAVGYFSAHEDLNAHNCQKFLEDDKFDRIAEELTNKYYYAPKFN
jgi:predicted nucleotidyltransferase